MSTPSQRPTEGPNIAPRDAQTAAMGITGRAPDGIEARIARCRCGHHRDSHATKPPTWCLHDVCPDSDPWSGDCDCEGFEPVDLRPGLLAAVELLDWYLTAHPNTPDGRDIYHLLQELRYMADNAGDTTTQETKP